VAGGVGGQVGPCDTCPAYHVCRDGGAESGCQSEFRLPEAASIGGRDVLHPLHPELTKRVWECGGLDIQIRTRTAQQCIPALPAYIPRVQIRTGFEARGCPAVAVPLDRVGLRHARAAAEFKQALKLDPGAIVVVSSFQEDSVLERAWQHRQGLVESLATAGYDLVTVPSFSLWMGDAPLEHRYNIARSLRMFEMLVEAGVPTMPQVSWYFAQRDVDEWIRELGRWRGLRAFSLDLQTLKNDDDWAWGLVRLRRLFEGIGQDWEVLVNGVAQKEHIRDVKEICGRVHLMNEEPFQLAMCQHMTDLCTGRRRPSTKTPIEVFAAEVQRMSDWASQPPPGPLAAKALRPLIAVCRRG
jgi:hypothetical protein